MQSVILSTHLMKFVPGRLQRKTIRTDAARWLSSVTGERDLFCWRRGNGGGGGRCFLLLSGRREDASEEIREVKLAVLALAFPLPRGEALEDILLSPAKGDNRRAE